MLKKAGMLAAGLGVALGFTTAKADDAINLSVAHFVPAGHIGVVHGTDVLIKETTEATGGKVRFTFYPAQQVGKASQFLDLLRSGAIDIAEVATGYVSSDRMPLLGILEMPGMVESICDGTRASRALGDPGGVMYESEYAPAGIRVLSYYVYPPYGPSASRVPIKSVEDLRGLKLRNAGGAMELSVAKVGAVPVKLTSPEVYQSLSRGTLDSMLSSFLTVADYDLASVVRYAVTGYSFGTPGVFTMMSERKFQSLPKDIQASLIEAGKKAEHEFCTFADAREAQLIKEFGEKKMEIYTWTQDDKQKLNKMLTEIPVNWAKALDARGKPGTKTLEAFKKALTSG